MVTEYPIEISFQIYIKTRDNSNSLYRYNNYIRIYIREYSFVIFFLKAHVLEENKRKEKKTKKIENKN